MSNAVSRRKQEFFEVPRSKWTAAHPKNREKHFIVTTVFEPEAPASVIELIEIEAVYTQRRFTLPWKTLTDDQQWLQGWL